MTSRDGAVRRYTHTDHDELQTITEPGISIENVYENGRVVRQINHFEDNAPPFTFEFTYRIEERAVVRTDTRRSDGSWSAFTSGPGRYVTSEAWGDKGVEPAVFTYERDPATNIVTALTLTCPARSGRPLRHSSIVRDGEEKWIKADLMQTHCSWTDGRWRRRDRRPQ